MEQRLHTKWLPATVWQNMINFLAWRLTSRCSTSSAAHSRQWSGNEPCEMGYDVPELWWYDLHCVGEQKSNPCSHIVCRFIVWRIWMHVGQVIRLIPRCIMDFLAASFQNTWISAVAVVWGNISVGAGAVANRLGAATLRRCEFRRRLQVVAWSRLTLRRCDVATLRRCEFGRRLRVVASDAATLRRCDVASLGGVFTLSRGRVWRCDAATLPVWRGVFTLSRGRVWRCDVNNCDLCSRLRVVASALVASDAATLRRCEFGRRLRVVASDAATLRRCDAATLPVWCGVFA